MGSGQASSSTKRAKKAAVSTKAKKASKQDMPEPAEGGQTKRVSVK
jgi:hypothetical protein